MGKERKSDDLTTEVLMKTISSKEKSQLTAGAAATRSCICRGRCVCHKQPVDPVVGRLSASPKAA